MLRYIWCKEKNATFYKVLLHFFLFLYLKSIDAMTQQKSEIIKQTKVSFLLNKKPRGGKMICCLSFSGHIKALWGYYLNFSKKKRNITATVIFLSFMNAADRNRTGTVSLQQDFKSCASASSATAAYSNG